MRINLDRRSLKDSLLSYAGTRDVMTNTFWGGMTALGGAMEMGYTFDPVTLYAFGGYHWLSGAHVQEVRQLSNKSIRMVQNEHSEAISGLGELQGLSGRISWK